MVTVACLYVDPRGVYSTLPGCELWGLPDRDARTYNGPHPCVAHPPCERWGRYWYGGPSAKVRRELGDDNGCFAAALAAVRRWGGVLEHPEASHAWRAHGLLAPPKAGQWIMAGDGVGFTCCVEQGHYGHPARKASWLYTSAPILSVASLTWGPCSGKQRLDVGYHSAAERAAGGRVAGRRLTKAECIATPPAFAAVLLAMARTARGER
jgi:hypothetical protein